MRLLSSSTSSSDGHENADTRTCRRVALWTIVSLVLLDLLLQRLCPHPAPDRGNAHGPLAHFFCYGCCLECKLDRALEDPKRPLVAGWLSQEGRPSPTESKQGGNGYTLAAYGMSFVKDMARSLEEQNPEVNLRLAVAPAAPPNHTYAVYTADRDGSHADVVVFGILASSIRGMLAATNMTWNFEHPTFFTYPTYSLVDGTLTASWPPVTSRDDLLAIRRDPARNAEFRDYLDTHDAYYDSFLYAERWCEPSIIIRLVRRAWFQHVNSTLVATIHGPEGFAQDQPYADLLKALVTDFARTARDDGKVPVIILIHDKGFADHLHCLLEETLTDEDIPFLSTHDLYPANDPRHFVGDGHFTREANLHMARLLGEMIDAELNASQMIAKGGSG